MSLAPFRALARKFGRSRPVLLTRYGHELHPWDLPSWDPDPTEFR